MKILIAVDDSVESHDAVDAAFDFFGPDHDYTVLSVQEPYPVLISEHGPVVPGNSAVLRTRIDAAITELSESTLHSAQARLPVEAAATSALGSPARAICKTAGDLASNLIVIGSHDKTFWQRLFDPSVGHYLVANAPCPVLVVR